MKSGLASVIGWVLVILVAIYFVGFIAGFLRFLLRSIIWFVVLGGLLWAYLALKDPPAP